MSLEVRGKIIETDPVGYLIHSEQWNEVVAGVLAEKEDLVLTAAHWEIMAALRASLADPGHALTFDQLQDRIRGRLGEEKASFNYLYKLFPLGIKQGCRLAGLPRPAGEI